MPIRRRHRLPRITDANGHTFLTNVYDDGRVVEQYDALGNLTTFAYDRTNRARRIGHRSARATPTTYPYDADARLTSETGSAGQHRLLHL